MGSVASTIFNLLHQHVAQGPKLQPLVRSLRKATGGISHVFTFLGFNANHDELGLRSSSYYYIPCNSTTDMDASAIQQFYRDTLLDPNVPHLSASIVFASAKDPYYSSLTMPHKSTAIIFSEPRDTDFFPFF